MKSLALLRWLAVLVSLCALPARAADPPDDAAALQLADDAPAAAKPKAGPWRGYVEGAVARGWFRNPASRDNGYRGSLDLRFDGTVAPGLRAVFSNRLDLVDGQAYYGDDQVNALREAYLSWQVVPDVTADVGRVNVRNGLAWGYNPTDYFRGGALRSIVTPDPAALRENRLGTVVVQAQKVWTDAAVSATFSPKLASRPSDATFSLDLGSTNARNRWLLTASRKFGAGFNPQLLLHGGEDTPTQIGLNSSTLLGGAAVGFVEASFGKGASLRAQVLGLPEADQWQQRAAVGVTYTTAFNLALTVEAHFNSAAPNRRQWDEVRAAPAGDLGLLQTTQGLQELPSRNGAFVYATWRDFGLRRLDLSGFVRYDVTTRSRVQWLETRYRWDNADLALQWQLYSGKADSIYGSVPQKRLVELSARVYF